ncbi:hypothetical protein GTY77_18320 [Streptomyces sp. SID8380]|nr:hypothetical protein [Streptomyces sp. SID8380]
MAFVRKRGSYWSFAVTETDPKTGKRVQITKSGYDSKTAALAAAKEFEMKSVNTNKENKDPV